MEGFYYAEKEVLTMELTVLFGAIGTLIGVIGAIATFKKSNKEEGMQDAETKAQLNYIGKGVNDIRIDQRAQALFFTILHNPSEGG